MVFTKMTNNLKIDHKLDCIGLYCPLPLVQTRNKIEEIEIGEILEVFADDPAAEDDIKRLVKRNGQELLKFENKDGVFRFVIKRLE